MRVEDIACVCHQVNKALCIAFGDNTQKDWEQAEQWQRDSAIKGVQFRLDNPLAKDSAQHDAWCTDKLNQGWVYGLVKDATKKEHPCLVPFNQLPPEQQAKDGIFCAVVDSLKSKQ